MNLLEIFEEAADRKASDIHLTTGNAPYLRISGGLVPMETPPLDRVALAELLSPVFSTDHRVRVESGIPVERTVVHGDIAFGGIFFRAGDDGIAATFRLLSNAIPSLDKVGEDAKSVLQEISGLVRGLVLIAGPAGSGKWTTSCAIADSINAERASRIFVIEEHPNYIFKNKKGLVTQIHVGVDCPSYESALDIAWQSDLDIAVLDFVPTAEAVRKALIVAEAGHLVIACMHAEGVVDAIKRLFDAAGSEVESLRRSLAENLSMVTAQRLFRRIDQPGRIPAYEWMKPNAVLKKAILDGDLDRLEALLESDPGCQTFGSAIRSLADAGKISKA